MFWQREVLRSGVGMTFNQTYELDLPKSGILGSLALYMRSTDTGVGFATAVKWRLIDFISKIEVIGDGAEVIKSFDGRQALACAYYDQGGIECPSMWRHYSNTPHRQWVILNFGRFLMDELFGLDLSRWNQVTLKITNDATSSEFTTDIDIDVIAYWVREGGMAFAGYFREEEWKKWDPAAAVTEYNDLPVALPIRRILLRARPAVDTADAKNNSSMHRLMNDIDFTYRTGQVRVYKGSLEQLGHLSVLETGRYAETRGGAYRTAGYGFEAGVGYTMQGLGYGGADADGITTALANKRQDVQDSAQEQGYNSANGMLEWSLRGHGYMHNVPLLEAKKPDLSDLMDPEALKVVKLDITCQTGTTVAGTHDAAENAIVLSRLVRR